ncbi:hypothetical protein HOP50_03g24010 [Chloropicon primus]|uniref:Uncharacterized protein n=1 Tax=Chloropicon primus TaxID=1764295 RepID=A0A5B8MIJ0_9CHLO|nr:hypothetical protein A3770_03p24020 [Chloropicon primus]UPQ99095.1 hypothetical protein HOP50_03g24010 [Chloropicon primus]|eukprot:QDZ19884.1 hypothetical protein A3770_03p24020 [Chloropicon primus]
MRMRMMARGNACSGNPGGTASCDRRWLGGGGLTAGIVSPRGLRQRRDPRSGCRPEGREPEPEPEAASTEAGGSPLGSLLPSQAQISEGFEKVGFVGGQGTRVKWGVLREKIPEGEALPNPEDREKRRREAAENLVNIDQEERSRRLLAGSLGMVVTTALAFLCTGQPFLVRMQKIEDEAISEQILSKVNTMNGRMFLITTALSIAYSAFPFQN